MKMSDAYLERIKKAKDSRAVIKTQLATFASTISEDIKIFCYEGVDDKKVYYQWIKTASSNLRYEPFICKGKKRVLQLLDSLNDDVTGLGNRVYYFIDRDFDDPKSWESKPHLFATDKYSIENYIVCPQVLEDILKIDFHCEGNNEQIKSVIESFNNTYTTFLSITKDINLRIFISRRCKIKQTEDTPTVSQIARIELTEAHPAPTPTNQFIKLEREPTTDELHLHIDDFEKLNPQHHYRGKFALQFFTKWLKLLCTDRSSKSAILFKSPPPEFRVKEEFSIENLAAKTMPPENLKNFLLSIT